MTGPEKSIFAAAISMALVAPCSHIEPLHDLCAPLLGLSIILALVGGAAMLGEWMADQER